MGNINLTSPYAMRNADLTFDFPGAEGPDSYTHHVTQAEYQPSASSGSVTTIGGRTVTDTSPATWVLALGLVQDDDADGLLRKLYQYEGASVPVTLRPRVVAGETGTQWASTVVISPANIGGTAGNTPVTSTVSLASDRPVPTTYTAPAL